MRLYPEIKAYVKDDGFFKIPQFWSVHNNQFTKDAYREIVASLKIDPKAITYNLMFVRDISLGKEAYKIEIKPDMLIVYHSESAGAFYAAKTLKQLTKEAPEGLLQCGIIFDEPDLATRGFMVDISRNKIPQMKTVYQLIDILSDLKYNHLELYVEGFSFEYPSFPELFKGLTPITVDDYRKLEDYAHDRFIDLVPCHNGLGHMTAWLEKEAYKDLAIIPEGMFMWGAHRAPSTINPLDPLSLELVKKYYGDVLLHSRSEYFHMNLDEPYEIGHGKTEDESKKTSVGQIYLDYLLKLYQFVKSHGRTPLVWGDVLNHYPETLKKLPKDMIFVDWGYDMHYPFKETLERLKSYKVPFMAAPGTSSWNSICGRTEDMFENIHQACFHTKHNHGQGILLTDWGDAGHIQQLPISFPGIVYAALESWRTHARNRQSTAEYINKYLLMDKEHIVGDLLLDMGRYNHFQTEYTHNGTAIMNVLWNAGYALSSERPIETIEKQLSGHIYASLEVSEPLLAEINGFYERLNASNIQASDKLYIEELKLSIDLLKAMVLTTVITGPHPITKKKVWIKEAVELWEHTLELYEKIWRKRNRTGGMTQSMVALKDMEGITKLYAKSFQIPLSHRTS
jgi:hypothetical protein